MWVYIKLFNNKIYVFRGFIGTTKPYPGSSIKYLKYYWYNGDILFKEI